MKKIADWVFSSIVRGQSCLFCCPYAQPSAHCVQACCAALEAAVGLKAASGEGPQVASECLAGNSCACNVLVAIHPFGFYVNKWVAGFLTKLCSCLLAAASATLFQPYLSLCV